jgi:cysteinyl-tRNA synthetase
LPNENEADDDGLTPPGDLPDIRNDRLAAIDDWAYVLQGDPVLDLDPIAASAFDLVVIDYSEDGSEEGEFSPADIEALKDDGNRMVLAYMSIGEAEVGRFYFDNAWVRPDPDDDPDGPFTLTDEAPGFLAPPNPLFPDNFKVRYWDPVWQEIIVSNPGDNPYIGDADSYLDRIVDAGFDGVYLDIIDAYEYFGPAENSDDGIEERRDSAELMIELVVAIAEHAEEYAGREFLVFPQNGAGVIDEQAFPEDVVQAGETPATHAERLTERYLAAIDGIGAEDTFYFGDEDEDNPLDPQTDVITWLDRFRAEGLLVLAIDYLTEPNAIDDFYDRAHQHGWVPYSGIRDLSELTANPGQEPD